MGIFNILKLANDYSKAKKFIESNKYDVEKAKKLIESVKRLLNELRDMREQLDIFISLVKIDKVALTNIIKEGGND